MPKKPRVLTAAETRRLETVILDAIPGSKGRAITRSALYERIAPHLRRGRIPARAVEDRLRLLRKAKKLNVSARVGMWTGVDPGPIPGKWAGGDGLRTQRRKIRRIQAWVCTRCFRAFPSKTTAKEHLPVHVR